MKVHLNEIILHFNKVTSRDFNSYSLIINEGQNIIPKLLVGNILVNSENLALISDILQLLHANKVKNLHSITFNWDDKKAIKKFLKQRYTYIKAAGGLVLKQGNYLFIYRLGKWDLPKGKLEKGEEIVECALREVGEECNITATEGPKIGNTWHCYQTKNGWCIKKSTWFLMHCTDDSSMKPQLEEDIEQILWVHPINVEKYLQNSYKTIADVFSKARKKKLI